MGRAGIHALVAVLASVIAGAAIAAAEPARPPKRALLPPGGIWQSIPYQAESEPSESTPVESLSPPMIAASAKPRVAEASRADDKPMGAKAPAPKARPARHPVAAADTAEQAPRSSAAARTKELERRLDVLMPGAKLNETMYDPDNPAWRRARPGRPGGEHNTFSVPFDDKGQSGFVARGYHALPDVQNPHGNTGATFGLRTRF